MSYGWVGGCVGGWVGGRREDLPIRHSFPTFHLSAIQLGSQEWLMNRALPPGGRRRVGGWGGEQGYGERGEWMDS